MQDNLFENETIEDLQLKGLKLIQKKEAFRFGMDSVLLAHFSDIRKQDKVADFGTGNGVLPILLYGRGKGSSYYAFDIQPEAAELAQRNAKLNHLDDRMTIINADAGCADQYLPVCSMDAVICNPPYAHPSSALPSPKESKAIARNQKEDTLAHLFTGAFRILKGRGKMFLIYPAPQMLYVMKTLQAFHLEPKKFQLIYPRADKAANLVLIEAVKDARPMLHPLPPMIVYNQDGTLTNELKSVYHIS